MKKINLKSLILFVILMVLFVWLITPSLIPFISDSTRKVIGTTLRTAFGGGDFGAFGLSLPRLLTLAAVLTLTAAIYIAICFVLEKYHWKGNRSRTIAGLALSVSKYSAVLVAIFWGLSVLGVNTTAMFASVGLIGLIIGFGAQSLIEDIITGVFIIFEGQFNVGDIIVVDDFRGSVIRIGVRTTVIQDTGGSMKIINNSDIRTLQNRSMDLSVAICDIAIAFDQDLPTVEKLLGESLPGIQNAFPDIMKEVPVYVGIQRFEGAAVILRIIARVPESNVFTAQRILNREIKLLFDANSIRNPYPKTAPVPAVPQVAK